MAGRTVVNVPGLEARTYEVLIGSGALARLAERCADHAPGHRYAVIADSRVAELYGKRILSILRDGGLDADLFTFPSGEWNKTRTSWTELSDDLLSAGHGRDSVVVAFGGGVTGDVAGFVASTFKRGVPVVQVPTTLLSMVDSAVGGKTGVDAAGSKNVIGTFHHPADVVIDPELLATLPRHQLVAGLAEAVKMGAILDANLFAELEREAAGLRTASPRDLEPIIQRCVELKAEVVGRDPLEAGERQILNFGHTAGHALETLAGFSILHGEAVAGGMRIEAHLGEVLGVTEPGTARRLTDVLEACGLPDAIEETEPTAEKLLEASGHDKKTRAGARRWVLLERIGCVHRAGGSVTRNMNETEEVESVGAALRAAKENADSPS